MNPTSENRLRTAEVRRSLHSLWILSALTVMLLTLTASARNWTEFSASSHSFTSTDRGRWSLGPDDQLFDLAGPWRLSPHYQAASDTVMVPFVWNGWEGRVQLTRFFKLPSELADRRWKLVVDGAAQSVEVILNNQSIDSRAGDDLSIQIDLGARALRFGDAANQINILLSNRLAVKDYPPLRGSIYARERYGGIARGLYLVCSPAVGLEDLQAAPVNSARGTAEALRVTAKIIPSRAGAANPALDPSAGSGGSLTLRAFVDDDSTAFYTSTALLSASTDLFLLRHFDIPLNSMSVIEPNDDRLVTQFRVEAEYQGGGIRHRMSARTAVGFPIWRNGWFQTVTGPLELRCVNYINADPTRGTAYDSVGIEDDVRMLLELGANAVRINQGRAHPYFLECCESSGLLVLEELPVFQTPDCFLGSASFIRSAVDQMTSMVTRDRNYACLAGWGIGADINPPNAVNTIWHSTLVKTARVLDARPVYFSTIFRNAVDAAPSDFVALEITGQGGLMKGPLPDNITCDRPALLSGLRSLMESSTTQSMGGYSPDAAQAAEILNLIAFTSAVRWDHGLIVGDFTDWEGQVPSISSPSKGKHSIYVAGLVSSDRKPRLSYRKLQEVWTQRGIEPPAAASLPSQDSSFLLIAGLVMLLTLFLSLKQNNILRVNVFRSLASPKGLFQDISHLRYFQTGHTWLLSGLISGVLGLTTAGWLYAQRENPAVDWLIGYVIGSNSVIEWIATLFWQPYRALLFSWLMFFVVIWCAALYANLICSWFRTRSSLAQSLDFIIWSMIVIVGALPLSMFAGRLYSNHGGFLLTALTLMLLLWGAARLIWAYKEHIRRSLVIVIAVWTAPFLLIGGVVFWLLNASLSLCDYHEFFQATILH